MRRLKLLMLAMFAILAFGAVAAAVASAEDGPPAILILEGDISELQGTFSGGGSTLSVLSNVNTIAPTAVTATLKECLPLGGTNKKDTNLCHMTVTFTGFKSGKVACRSEVLAGTKDPVETVLMLLDAHLADERTLPGEVLEPLLIFKVIAEDNDSELIINCGGLKQKVKGEITCLLLPGLTEVAANTNVVEVLCKTTATLGDQETGMCLETKPLCELLEKEPFQANLGGGFEMAALLVHMKGSFNKNIFIDD